MITERDCIAADHIIRASGAGDLFGQGLRRSPRGRKAAFPAEVLLIGKFLAAQAYGDVHLTTVHRVLTREVPIHWQETWGVVQGAKVIREFDLQHISRRVSDALDHTAVRLRGRVPDEQIVAEQQRRRATLNAILDAIIDATLTPRPAGSADYAVDGTGLWAAERARRKAPSGPIVEGVDEEDRPVGVVTEDDTSDAGRKAVARDRRPSDAGYGVKTKKDGSRGVYYGYEMHGLVRVPVERGEPALLERLRLTPASEDVIEPTFEAIDSVLRSGQAIKHLMADRHYSYKKFDRWVLPLIERNIRQIVDLRVDDHGFTEWDGLLIAAAWAHCPATPVRLGRIPKPAKDATAEEWDQFRADIEERSRFACRLSKPMDERGTVRWECPAIAGTIGCPRRAGTVDAARELGLPIVANPPAEADAPTLCQQASIAMKVDNPGLQKIMKVHQREYWGSQKHTRLFNRRTFVEGWFGVFKGDTTAKKKRGSSLATGIAHASIEAALFATVANTIMLRAWHRDHPDAPAAHPLLAPDDLTLKTVQVTEAEAAMLAKFRAAAVA